MPESASLAPEYVSCADPHGPVMDAAAFWHDHDDADPRALATFARTWVCIATLRRRQRFLLERAAAWLASVHADWCVATRVYSGLRLLVMQCTPGREKYARRQLREVSDVYGGYMTHDGLGHRIRPCIHVRISHQAPSRPPPPPTTPPPRINESPS